MNKVNLPSIGIVIIGLNVEKYIATCIESIHQVHYPQEKLQIVYVDGGSNDMSVAKAKTFPGVQVVELRDPSPTPGRGRNTGFKILDTPLVQFLDADTILHSLWFEKALPLLREDVVAVFGNRTEKYPNKNFYHIVGSLEWAGGNGHCKHFGGSVLIRRDIVEQSGGYDPGLIAGEDPELSYRIRQLGYSIYHIGEDMEIHDLNMTSLRQYLKRSFRTGHAYAEVGLRYIFSPEKFWLRELLRVVLSVLLPLSIIVLGTIFSMFWQSLLIALLIALRNFFKITRTKKKLHISSWKKTFLYTWHLSIVVYPQFCGVIRYLLTLIFKIPLRNKGITN